MPEVKGACLQCSEVLRRKHKIRQKIMPQVLIIFHGINANKQREKDREVNEMR
jgi:hypothetical protein